MFFEIRNIDTNTNNSSKMEMSSFLYSRLIMCEIFYTYKYCTRIVNNFWIYYLHVTFKHFGIFKGYFRTVRFNLDLHSVWTLYLQIYFHAMLHDLRKSERG